MSSLSLKAKFTIISMLAVFVIAAAAVENYLTMHKMALQAEAVGVGGELLKNHMDGDMMHDGIRADVLKASLAVKLHDIAMAEEAKTEAAEHGARFIGNLEANLKLDIPEEVKALLHEADPALRSYNDMAAKYTEAAISDVKNGTAAAAALYPAFNDAFGVLEDSQEKLGEKIEGYLQSVKDVQLSTAAAAQKLAIAVAVITILLSLAVPVYARYGLFSPQHKLIGVMQGLAEGRIDADIPFVGRKDEVGHIASTLLVFKRNAEEKIRLEKEQEEQKKRAEHDRRRAMLELAGNFETSVKGVVDTVASASTEMDATANDVMKRAQDSSSRLGELVQGIGTASHNVQTVASAASQLSASITEISNQVSRSSQITSTAVQEAKRANATAAGLSEAAQKIGNVINVINEITGQINLLALNATIEAARAGEAGKGFAVVASEVKNLASQTTKATQEIEEQISTIQSSASDTVGVIQQISTTIDEINKISSSIAAAVEEQGMATQEIARNVQQAAEVTQTISDNATGVRQTTSDTSAAVGEMISAASELARQSETLRGQVGGFLNHIRAA